MLGHRLRHRIAIQAPTVTQNSTTGEESVAWSTALPGLDAVPAEVLTGPGREFSQSGAMQAETTARINIRWFSGLEPTWRILWDGRVYNIRSIETDLSGRMEWRIICTDGVNDGR